MQNRVYIPIQVYGIFCVTCVTLHAISGIFFLYTFLVRDPGKRVHSDASDALKILAGAGIFGARRNSLTGPFGIGRYQKELSNFGTGRPGPHPSGTRGLASSPRNDPALSRSSQAVWQLPGI